MSEDKMESMGKEVPGVFSQRQIDDIDRDIARQPRTMPGFNMAALAMLAGPLPPWMYETGYSPPRIPQTEESKAAALQAAEEKRARRRAKRAKG